MLSAEITITKDIADVEKLFSSEDREFGNKRASYDIKREKDRLIFRITAKDSSALRAVLNSITKLLSVYEKTKGAIKGDIDEQ
jgi:tRNA threonylcarbamoyladenosine modification (KEOPS) complex  Pcc1 subunit